MSGALISAAPVSRAAWSSPASATTHLMATLASTTAACIFSWHAYLMNEDFYRSLTDQERDALHRCIEIAKTIHRGT